MKSSYFKVDKEQKSFVIYSSIVCLKLLKRILEFYVPIYKIVNNTEESLVTVQKFMLLSIILFY